MSTETTTPPAPDPRCPVCGSAYRLPAPRHCRGCGLDLTDPTAERIRVIDAQRAHLTSERARLAEVLRTRSAVGSTTPTAAATSHGGVTTPRSASHAGDPPPETAHPAAHATPPVPERRSTVATLLGFAGAALLASAAVVFTAVAWEALPATGQAAVLVTATIAAAILARWLDHRGLATTAGVLAVLAAVFAGVVVLGAERADITSAGRYTPPLAAAVTAVTALALARTGLRWVGLAGALAALGAVVSLTSAFAATTDVAVSVAALVGTAAAAIAFAGATVWPNATPRAVLTYGAIAWVGVCGLLGVVDLATRGAPTALAAAAVLVPAGLLAAAARRWPAAIAGAVVVASTGVVAAGAHLQVDDTALNTIAAVAVSVVAGGTVRLPVRWRVWAGLGAVPVATATAAAVLATAAFALERYVTAVSGAAATPVDPWLAATVVLTTATLAATPSLRAVAGPTVAVGGFVALAGLPPVLAATGAAAVAAGLLLLRAGRAADGVAALVLVGAASGWVSSDHLPLATATAVAAALCTGAAWDARDSGDGHRTVRGVAIGIGAIMLAVSVSSLLRATVVEAGPASIAGVAVAFVVLAGSGRLLADRPVAADVVAAGLVTVAAPLVAGDATWGGAALLVAATGWLGLAVTTHPLLRWVSALVAGAGNAVLLADAGVTVLEAYTVVPAALLTAAGVWWLHDDPRVPTRTALAPGLVLGLLPSLVRLTDDPRVLPRAIALAVVAAGLGVIGARLRWQAPTIAAVVAAIGVAVTQLTIVAAEIPRWVTFATIGALLVWIAATYERQQTRARHLGAAIGRLR